jgi:tryptophanyl-tRNA synthetase
MAADILAYQSNLVPVGKDQKQHVEVTRDIAIRFNSEVKRDVFAIPEPVIRESVAVVPGIDGQKMSKSYNNHIELFAPEKETKARIMRVVTDSTPLEQPKDPDKCNVFALYRLFATEAQVAEMAAKYRAGGFGYGEAKKALFAIFWEVFAPFRQRRAELAGDLGHVESVLRHGAERARAEARKTLNAARAAMGLD